MTHVHVVVCCVQNETATQWTGVYLCEVAGCIGPVGASSSSLLGVLQPSSTTSNRQVAAAQQPNLT